MKPIIFNKDDSSTWPEDNTFIWHKRNGKWQRCKNSHLYVDLNTLLEIKLRMPYSDWELWSGEKYYPCTSNGWIDAEMITEPGLYLVKFTKRIDVICYRGVKDGWPKGYNGKIKSFQFLPEGE